MMDERTHRHEDMTLAARDMWLLKRILQALLVANVITVSLWAFWAIVTAHPCLVP